MGNVTSAVVSNLAVGTTYFFALSAFDAVGLESELSAEIHWVILAPAENLSLQLAVNYQGQPALTATGPAGWRCELLVSTDLRSWSVLTNFTMKPSGTYQFKDSAVLSNEPSARYYRLSTSTAPGLNPR